MTPKETEQLVDDLRLARAELMKTLMIAMGIADKITDQLVALLKVIR